MMKTPFFWLLTVTSSLLIVSPCYGQYDELPPKKSTRVMSINIGAPQQLSFSLGTAISYPARTFEYGPEGVGGGALLFQIEPGLAGAKAGIGYGFFGGMAGGSAKIVALRTWWNPWLAQPDTTYIGLEASVSFLFRLALGPLYCVTSNDHGSRWAFLGSIGVGF